MTASNVFYAIGHYRALLFSPFGIEEFFRDDLPEPDAALVRLEEGCFEQGEW